MKRLLLVAWALSMSALFDAPAAADGPDPERGKTTFLICVACHGQNAEGNRALNAPRLAGQEAWYMKTQLLKFRGGIRGANPKDLYGMQMAPMSQVLVGDTAIDDVIAYIGTLKTDIPPDPSSGDPKKGETLFQVCVACHGPQGQGNVEQKAPRLQGQHAWYMARQLKNFKEGIRGVHPDDVEGKLMLPMSATLTDDAAIENVTAYIQTLGTKPAETE